MTVTFRHRYDSSADAISDSHQSSSRLAWALPGHIEGFDYSRDASQLRWQPPSAAAYDARRSLDVELTSRRRRSASKSRATPRRRCGSSATTTFGGYTSATCFGSDKSARHTHNTAANSAPRLPRNSSVAEAIESGSGSPMVSLANLRSLNLSKEGSVLEGHGPGCAGTALKSKRRLTWKGFATKPDVEESKSSPAATSSAASTTRKVAKSTTKEPDGTLSAPASPRRSGTWLGSKLYRRATLSRLPHCVSSPSMGSKEMEAEVVPPLPPIAPQYLEKNQRSMYSPRRSFHGSRPPSMKSREGPILWPSAADADSAKPPAKVVSRTPSTAGSFPNSLGGTTLGAATPEFTTQLEWCPSPPSPSLSQTWESFATSTPLLGAESVNAGERRQEIAATERTLSGGGAAPGRSWNRGTASAATSPLTQLADDPQRSGSGLRPAPPRRSQRANTFHRPPSGRSSTMPAETALSFRKRSASSSSSVASDRPIVRPSAEDQHASYKGQRLSVPEDSEVPPSPGRIRGALPSNQTTKRGRSATLSQVEGDTRTVQEQNRSVSTSSTSSSLSSRRQRRGPLGGPGANTGAQPDVIEEMDEEEFRATPPRGVYASLEEDLPGEPFAPGNYPSLCAVGLVTPTFGGAVSRAAGASASRSRVSIYSVGTPGSATVESAAPSPQVGRGWEPYTPAPSQPVNHSRDPSVSDTGHRQSGESSSSQTSMESLSSVLLPMPTPPLTVRPRDAKAMDSPMLALAGNEAERTAMMSAIPPRPARPPKGRGRSKSPTAKVRAASQAGAEGSPSWVTRREQRKTEEEQLHHSQLQACLGLGIVRDEDSAEDRRFW